MFSISLVNSRLCMSLLLICGGVPLLHYLSRIDGGVSGFTNLSPLVIKLFASLTCSYMIICLNHQGALKNIKHTIPYLIFLAYATLTICWSSDLGFGLRMIIKLITPIIIYLAIPIAFKETKDYLVMERSVFIASLICISFGIFNYIFDIVPSTIRATIKTFSSPAFGASLTALHLAPIACLALSNLISKRDKFHILMFISLLGFVLLSMCRIAIFGMIISMYIIYITRGRLISLKILLPICVLLAFCVTLIGSDSIRSAFFFETETNKRWQLDNISSDIDQIDTSGRSTLWSDAYNTFFLKHPIIGCGLGVTSDRLSQINSGARVIHSEILRLLCETGIIGLSLFLFSMIYFLYKLCTRYTIVDDQGKKYISLSFSLIIFFIITMTTDNTLDYVNEVGIYVFGFTSIALSYKQSL